MLEAHNITTADGHVLTLHRIPRGANATANGTQLESPRGSSTGSGMGSGAAAAAGPNATANATGAGRPVVLLQHGLSFSAAAFLVLGHWQGKGLAFVLADEGVCGGASARAVAAV